jgi:hypothetical protein
MSEPTGFGHRVIGQEAAAREAETIKTSANVYGSRVLGSNGGPPPALMPEATTRTEPAEPAGTPTFLELAPDIIEQRVQAINTLAALDELLTQEQAGARRDAVLAVLLGRRKAIEQGAAMSVNDLRKALADNTAFLDEAIIREGNRPRPRKEATRLFLDLENQRIGGARAEVLRKLNAWL